MDVNKLFGSAIAELEKMLTSKSAVGKPIKIGDATIVPLTSVGFAFGAGGGAGAGQDGSGEAGMTGGGGGVRPIAVLISDKNGVRIETLTTASSLVGKVADTISEVARSAIDAKRLQAASAPKVVLPQAEQGKRIAVESDSDE